MSDALSYGAGRLTLLVTWILAQLTIWLVARYRSETHPFSAIVLCGFTVIGLSVPLIGAEEVGIGRWVLAVLVGVMTTAAGVKLLYEDLHRWQFWLFACVMPIYFLVGFALAEWVANRAFD